MLSCDLHIKSCCNNAGGPERLRKPGRSAAGLLTTHVRTGESPQGQGPRSPAEKVDGKDTWRQTG